MIKVNFHWCTIGGVNYTSKDVDFDGVEGTFWYDIWLPAVPRKGDSILLANILHDDLDPGSVVYIQTETEETHPVLLRSLPEPAKLAGNLVWRVSEITWGRSSVTKEVYIECLLRDVNEQIEHDDIMAWKAEREG